MPFVLIILYIPNLFIPPDTSVCLFETKHRTNNTETHNRSFSEVQSVETCRVRYFGLTEARVLKISKGTLYVVATYEMCTMYTYYTAET